METKMNFRDTFSIAMGFAVGSGVITMTGIAIGMTGRSVILSYIISATMFLIAVIPNIIMTAVYPTKSASYTYTKEMLGEKMGGFYMYIYFLGRLTITIFGISCAQYLATVFPGINVTLVAALILTFFFIVNLLGTKTVARTQNIMFYLMLFSLGTFIVLGLGKVDIPAYFKPEGFMINGFDGVWSASSLLVFAIGGGGVLVDFANIIDKPEKTIPRVIILVTALVAVAYALLSIVIAGALPYEDVAFKPLTISVAALFGQTSPMFYLFLFGGAILALTTTLNSSFIWYTNAMLRGCEEGWFPKALTKKNRFGVEYRLTTLFYLFGLVLTLLNVDLTVISKMAVAMTVIMWAIPVYALVNMPKKHPELWNKSKYAKTPKWLLWVLSTLAFVIYSSQAISLLKGNPVLSNVIIGVYVACVVVYLVFFCKKKNTVNNTVTEPVTNLELKNEEN